MNGILLNFPSVGDQGVVISTGISGSWANGFCIGYDGLSGEYNDLTSNQISTHIWAFLATGASPYWLSSAITGTLGNYVHDYGEGLLGRAGASWKDLLVSHVALTIGYRLRMGNFSPQDVSQIFEANFGGQASYFDFANCPQCKQQYGQFYSDWLQANCPIGPGGGGLSNTCLLPLG